MFSRSLLLLYLVRLRRAMLVLLVPSLLLVPIGAEAGGANVTLTRIDRIQYLNNVATMDVVLNVKNPTSLDLTLSSLDFQCVFNNQVQASGASRRAVTVAGNGQADIPVRLTMTGDNIVAFGTLIAQGGTLSYRIDGSAMIEPMGLQLPFSHQGQLPLPH